MAERKKIALTYSYSENWIAGSYYVANIIQALNQLEDGLRPHISLLHETNEGLQIIHDIGYPYIAFIYTGETERKLADLLSHKLRNRILGSSHQLIRQLRGVEHIFEGNEKFKFIKNQYFWVHDFQELRLPHFFSKEDADKRSALPKKVSTMPDATLIVSSYDALNDFKTYFPGYKCRVKVWRFASSLPDFSDVDIAAVCEEFYIDKPFFLCSNQFWQHKNHTIILEAIQLLKEKNYAYQVVFTGKAFDHRNPKYTESLHQYIETHGLRTWTNFVGFIDRKVQLCLGKNAMSYIQPSFFEGWSTTVEDAKNMSQYVLLSDIPVHREQLDYNVSFFNPENAEELAALMEKVILNQFQKIDRDYNQHVRQYGMDIIQTFFGE
jgi:glycosyltransferase involved in cell wall biosynthesis